jgi:hypothetical protein
LQNPGITNVVFFIFAGEIGGLFVIETERRFLDCVAIVQQFNSI